MSRADKPGELAAFIASDEAEVYHIVGPAAEAGQLAELGELTQRVQAESVRKTRKHEGPLTYWTLHVRR